ncbi:hypothetical protein THAOC_29111, partial [Thalassiosira oceanica]
MVDLANGDKGESDTSTEGNTGRNSLNIVRTRNKEYVRKTCPKGKNEVNDNNDVDLFGDGSGDGSEMVGDGSGDESGEDLGDESGDELDDSSTSDDED